MKPYVICHMVTTIDGRILSGRWPTIPGHPKARGLYERTAASFGINAWFVGKTTMAEYAAPHTKLRRSDGKIGRGDHIVNRGAKGYAIGADTKGELRWRKGMIDDEHVIVILTNRASDAYLAHLQSKGVSYLICGDREIDLPLALDKLARHLKLKKLMLEGGGKINGSFLKKGLIDEVSHITVPIADGGEGVSTFFDIPGKPTPRAAATLKLISTRTLKGGVIWSRYRVVKSKW